ncbi:MAG: hypothetical protein J0I10_23170 [Verrucomicrobia bacterium]|nr:hypothetical protein [Verrucomicrobiota bacterium]
MRNRRYCRSAFSLVEVVMALGIISFALLTVLALLPLGMKSNLSSVEETRACNILTSLEADLRNSFSEATPATSAIFQLPAPYKSGGSPSRPAFNDSLTAGSFYTTGLDEDEMPVGPGRGVRYQASLVYIRIPSSGSLAPIQARLVVSWPCLPSATAADVTDQSKVNGFVESLVTFPSP